MPRLVMTDVKSGESVEVIADHVIERARKTATGADRIADNLSRLGETPFETGFTGIDVEIDDDIMMPVSIVNRMRREASDELVRRRSEAAAAGRRSALGRAELDVAESAELLGAVSLDIDRYEEAACSRRFRPVPLEEFMIGAEDRADNVGESGINDPAVLPYILNVSKGRLDRYIEDNWESIVNAVRDKGILIGNLGWIKQFRDAGIRVYGDYGLNVYNEQARKAFEEVGVELYMPSHETGVSDERGIPLMITEHHVEARCLTDRKGALHRVVSSPSGDKTLIY